MSGSDMTIEYRPIGTIHTPFTTQSGTPIQPNQSSHARGWIDLQEKFLPALRDLDGFSHIILLYHLHLSSGYELVVKPYLDTIPRGLFATRAPRRPNGIGLSVVRLVALDGHRLDIEDVDMIDGTPLLDIKPFIPSLVSIKDCRTGWLEGKMNRGDGSMADDRFSE